VVWVDAVVGLVVVVALGFEHRGVLSGGSASALYSTAAQVAATILSLALVPIGAMLSLAGGRRMAELIEKGGSAIVRQTTWAFAAGTGLLVAAAAGLVMDPGDQCGHYCLLKLWVRRSVVGVLCILMLAMMRLAWTFASAMKLASSDATTKGSS
jgi:hypothetical protein